MFSSGHPLRLLDRVRGAATTPRTALNKPLSEWVQRCKRFHTIHHLHVMALGSTGVLPLLHSGDHHVDWSGGVVCGA
ncbi:MAG: hypothetical protein KatS3mg054_1372 [Chloroflexus sp.]|nr:MAG: hypothetical protein KatS3mg054_1372 [Chloroflexus sp.]